VGVAVARESYDSGMPPRREHWASLITSPPQPDDDDHDEPRARDADSQLWDGGL
jgi:hypothetical protein